MGNRIQVKVRNRSRVKVRNRSQVTTGSWAAGTTCPPSREVNFHSDFNNRTHFRHLQGLKLLQLSTKRHKAWVNKQRCGRHFMAVEQVWAGGLGGGAPLQGGDNSDGSVISAKTSDVPPCLIRNHYFGSGRRVDPGPPTPRQMASPLQSPLVPHK